MQGEGEPKLERRSAPSHPGALCCRQFRAEVARALQLFRVGQKNTARHFAERSIDNLVRFQSTADLERAVCLSRFGLLLIPKPSCVAGSLCSEAMNQR